jgi:acetoin:2,6-dichlorophenolindophenol oxidoreductase subunit beta
MSRVLSYTQAIQEATDQAMGRDRSVFVLGLGVTYPNGADGTTAGLAEKYPDRVFDMPCSENAATGMCNGAAHTGMRPILVHSRVEFGVFGFDQLVTQAAKWNYMFGGNSPLPLVVRMSVGRRWGDGPQHTQVLHSVFGHIPGLKVVIPSTPSAAKGLMIASIEDNNPVVFLEHRWLYDLKETVPEEYYSIPLDKCNVIREGKDVTIVANSDTLIEAMRCAEALTAKNINPEIIDLVSANPIDYDTIIASVKKTGRLMVLDVGTKSCGIGSEIISRVVEEAMSDLVCPPLNIAAPDVPCPTSPSLTEQYYPTAETIVSALGDMFGVNVEYEGTTDFRKIHLPSDENLDELRSYAHIE